MIDSLVLVSKAWSPTVIKIPLNNFLLQKQLIVKLEE